MVATRAVQPPAVVRGARQKVVVGVTDVVEHQADDGQGQQRRQTEVVQHHGQQDHVAQQHRLQRVKAVGGPGRGDDRAVVRQVKALEPARVQQPVVGVEVHFVPQCERQHLQRDLQGAGLVVDACPTQLEQPPRHQQPGAEDDNRQRRQPPFARQLPRRHGAPVQHRAVAQHRQHAPREPQRERAQQQIDGAEVRQAERHHLVPGQVKKAHVGHGKVLGCERDSGHIVPALCRRAVGDGRGRIARAGG